MWEIHPCLCTNVTVRGVTINSHGPNNDGCDPESCRDVLIEKCTFDTGDDCIALKSGRNNDGRRLDVPVENVIVRDCVMKDGHGGVTIGSEISGGARNVFAERCRMDSPNLDRALRIKTNAVRGGLIEHVYMRDVTVGQVAEAVVAIDFFYEEADKGALPADGARRRGAERHEPEEPVRAAAARVPDGADHGRAPRGLHVRQRREAGPARGREGPLAHERHRERHVAQRDDREMSEGRAAAARDLDVTPVAAACALAPRQVSRAVAAWLAAVFLACAPAVAAQAPSPATPGPWRFDFGTGAVAAGHQQVVSTTLYTAERRFGFVDASAVRCLDRGTSDIVRSDFCTSDRPFVFAVDVPEGNYAVTVTLGDAERETWTTVYAESRRLVAERVHTGAGEFVSRSFVVNVRNSRLPDGGRVSLKPREVGAFHWDDQLTLTFADARPAVAAIEIVPVEVPTVFLAGDSTVTDQTADHPTTRGARC